MDQYHGQEVSQEYLLLDHPCNQLHVQHIHQLMFNTSVYDKEPTFSQHEEILGHILL